MLDKLSELVSNGDYKEALYEFQDEFLHIEEKSPQEASKLCVFEATLWEALCDSRAEFDAISRGLSYNQKECELFYMLGLYYININLDQAFLCMEMALHYCEEADDREIIQNALEEIRSNRALRVRNTSIMILSYNDLDIMKECIEAIEEYQPAGSFEIVVADNASTEPGVLEYLREKKAGADYNFVLIENPENYGFSKGCNIGAAACDPGNDIFFLNNDAVLTRNALFFLRMGLYENRNVGATGPFSNSASLQELPVKELMGTGPEVKEALIRHAARHSIPMAHAYIRRFRLTGFAVLVAREALDAVAPDMKVFDEYFSPAYFEDDDLGFRIAKAGFSQYLCKNSFVYHRGGSGFSGDKSRSVQEAREKFTEKWGFDIWGYCHPWYEVADQVIDLAAERGGILRVIDFTCGMGANASYIKSMCPDVYVAGVCFTSIEAGVAGNMADDVVWGEPNTLKLPWPEHSFDVAIAQKQFVSKARIAQCLKVGGICLGE